MADEPNLGELGRSIEAFRRDVRDDFGQISAQISNLLPREVYNSDRAALEARMAADARSTDARLSRIERENESNRSSARNAIFAAVGAFVASVASGILLVVLLKGH